MSDTSLKETLKAAMKAAMIAKDKPRLQTIRLIQSEIKRIEVDERIELDDQRVLAVFDKMLKQRRDSAQQYTDAGRQELADQELFEISIIQEFMPEQLDEAEILALVDAAMASVEATGMQAMGPIMAQLKPQLQGKADMSLVSKLVKQRLS
jgi:uncharacterized protein YqeY